MMVRKKKKIMILLKSNFKIFWLSCWYYKQGMGCIHISFKRLFWVILQFFLPYVVIFPFFIKNITSILSLILLIAYNWYIIVVLLKSVWKKKQTDSHVINSFSFFYGNDKDSAYIYTPIGIEHCTETSNVPSLYTFCIKVWLY